MAPVKSDMGHLVRKTGRSCPGPGLLWIQAARSRTHWYMSRPGLICQVEEVLEVAQAVVVEPVDPGVGLGLVVCLVL